MNKILTAMEDETGKEYIQNPHSLSIHTSVGLEIYIQEQAACYNSISIRLSHYASLLLHI